MLTRHGHAAAAIYLSPHYFSSIRRDAKEAHFSGAVAADISPLCTARPSQASATAVDGFALYHAQHDAGRQGGAPMTLPRADARYR